MIETAPKQTASTFAVAVGAAMLANQAAYPVREEPYRVVQIDGTYSAFVEGMKARSLIVTEFANSVASIYGSFAQRQQRLGADFEQALYEDVESLYDE